MFTLNEHIDDLTRHITMVQLNAKKLADHYIDEGQLEFARILLANAQGHDQSKWHGIEWLYLHQGDDVPKEKIELARCQHIKTNQHHPEYWGGIDKMPDVFIAEMVCDWLSRAQEFGKDIRQWIDTVATPRFNLTNLPEPTRKIKEYLDILTKNTFVS